MPLVEEPRQKKPAGKEQHFGNGDIERGKRRKQTGCKEGNRDSGI